MRVIIGSIVLLWMISFQTVGGQDEECEALGRPDELDCHVYACRSILVVDLFQTVFEHRVDGIRRKYRREMDKCPNISPPDLAEWCRD